MKDLSKKQLIQQLKLWQQHQLTNEELQDWMVSNYDPYEVTIGKGEPEWTQEAMNIVMNEYEIAKIDKFRHENVQLAIDFINCEENKFNQTRHLFLQQGFTIKTTQ